MLGTVLDYDDAGPNPKHDPRKKPGPGGKPWLQQISCALVLINLSLNIIVLQKIMIFMYFLSLLPALWLIKNKWCLHCSIPTESCGGHGWIGLKL